MTTTPAAEGGSSTGLLAGAAGTAGVLALLVGAWVWWRCRTPKSEDTSLTDANIGIEVSDPTEGGNLFLPGEAAALGEPAPAEFTLSSHLTISGATTQSAQVRGCGLAL